MGETNSAARAYQGKKMKKKRNGAVSQGYSDQGE